MDNTVMLGLQAAVAVAADTAGGMTAIPEGGESFSAVLAAQTGQTVQTDQKQAVQENTAVQNGQAEETCAAADTISASEEEASSKTALDVIFDLLEATEDDGTLKGMKILAKAVLNAMAGDSTFKKKTDLFSFMGEGYDLWSDGYGNYDMFLTGTEMLNQIGIALRSDLADAEKMLDSGLFMLDVPETEDIVSPLDEIISKLDKIIKKLYSADEDETDENAAADMLAALLDIPADVDLDYVLAPAKEQAIEAAAEVFTAAKKLAAEESPEDVPKMERLFEEFSVKVKSDKPEAEQELGANKSFNVSFAAVKINNAAEQLKSINGEEAAAAAVVPETVRIVNDVSVETSAAEIKSEPVESQITEKIAERLFEMKEDNGTEELIMVLKPENLGQVAIKLIKENGAVSVLLSAQYDEVGKLMAERASNLGGSLTSRDVQVKDINVVDPSNAAEQMGLSFTDQGFSFARSFGGSSDRDGDFYRKESVSGIEEIDGDGAAENIEIIREAGKWQTIA